jgi:hypothetical protein
MDLAVQCELGQRQLMRMEYLAAEKTLAGAEEIAWANRDFDSLSRLYMPLQEARRQRRQRCGEGTIRLDLLARGAQDAMSAEDMIAHYPQGQLLVAGFASIEPAVKLRRLQVERGNYLDTFLAAVYKIQAETIVAIVAFPDAKMPDNAPASLDALAAALPPNSIVMPESQLPRPNYGNVMALWERLHTPFLAEADRQRDPIRKIEAYRQSIRADYACELAHQRLSDVARQMCKTGSAT